MYPMINSQDSRYYGLDSIEDLVEELDEVHAPFKPSNNLIAQLKIIGACVICIGKDDKLAVRGALNFESAEPVKSGVTFYLDKTGVVSGMRAKSTKVDFQEYLETTLKVTVVINNGESHKRLILNDSFGEEEFTVWDSEFEPDSDAMLVCLSRLKTRCFS